MDKIITNKDILRQVSRDTTLEEVKELDLINRLREANKHAWTPGCGLAAIQIGYPIRFSWFQWGLEEFTLLNPKILEYSGEIKKVSEGCLSIPDNYAIVSRAYKIKYISHGERRTAKVVKAQIIQHEIDHMDGVLNIDGGRK